MPPAPAHDTAHDAEPPCHRADADDHHGPGAGLGHAAGAETRNIAEIARSIGQLGLVAPGSGTCEVGQAWQLHIVIELQRRVVQESIAPRIVDRYPVRIGLEQGRHELAWHLEHRRIVIAARSERLVPYARSPRRLDRWRNGGRGAPLAHERKKAPLIAWKDRDQEGSDQQQEQHAILPAALRTHPVSRRGGRSHAIPHPPSEEWLLL